MGGFVYLDESGDTGFKFHQGSSQYLIVTILLVDDPLPLSAAIEDLRRSLHFRENHEFKFTSSSEVVRKAFIRVLVKHEVVVRALVVNKTQLTGPSLQQTESFYSYLVQLLLRHDGGRLNDATLILDEREKGKKSKQGLMTYLRRQLNAGTTGQHKIGKIRYHVSHRDNLLQAVDMASGAIYAHYSRKEPEYLRLLRVKIDDLWEFVPDTQ